MTNQSTCAVWTWKKPATKSLREILQDYWILGPVQSLQNHNKSCDLIHETESVLGSVLLVKFTDMIWEPQNCIFAFRL